jgi:diadenosine tetraphosphate (Ap4A) HIT family hydrolase
VKKVNAKSVKRKKNAATAGTADRCELCAQTGGELLWRDKRCRVVLVADPDYAGFCRVIWQAHVGEMTDLRRADQTHCMRVVFAVERALREAINPHKINLASLGNMTPHLHWHVIARNRHDAHFPNPVWGRKLRVTRRKSVAMSAMILRKRLAAAVAKLI